MRKSFSIVALVIVTMLINIQTTKALTKEQKHHYADWTDIMAYYKYNWEPYIMRSEDGYDITLMRVFAKKQRKVEAEKSPILVVSGMITDPHHWLNVYAYKTIETNPVMFDLLEQGHSLWFLY